MVQFRPSQVLLNLEQLAPNPALDRPRVRWPGARTFQAPLDLPPRARFTIANATGVASGELKDARQAGVAMIQAVIERPPHHLAQEHQFARGIRPPIAHCYRRIVALT